MNLISATMFAPWCAIEPEAEPPGLIHALTMEAVVEGWDTQEFKSPCGLEVKLLPVLLDDWGDGEHEGGWACLGWPPRVANLTSGVTRCRECHELTGRKRPSDRAMIDRGYPDYLDPPPRRPVETIRTDLV